MIKPILLIMLTATAFLAEPIVSAAIANPAIRPDVIAIPLVVAVLTCPGSLAVVCGGLIGLICDCLTGHRLGPQMAAFSVIAAIGSLALPRSRSMTGVFSLSFGCTVAVQIASLAVPFALDGSLHLATPNAIEATSSSLATATVIVGVWFIGRRLTRPFARRFNGERIVSAGWRRGTD